MQLNWAPIGKGRIALGHRPKLRALQYFPAAGCDLVVTVLSEKEGALEIGNLVHQSGMQWIWIPLASGNPPRNMPAELVEIEAALHGGASIFIHCSAGMHRTGMISFAVLRRMGNREDEIGISGAGEA